MKSPGWLYRKAGLWKGAYIATWIGLGMGMVIGFGIGWGAAHWQINSDYLYRQNETFLTIFKNHWKEFKR